MTNEQQPFYFGSFTFLPKLAVMVKGIKMRANVCVIFNKNSYKHKFTVV